MKKIKLNENDIENLVKKVIKEEKLNEVNVHKIVKKVISITVPRPMNYKRIISINKGEIDLVPSEIPDLEIGPNRCAVDSK